MSVDNLPEALNDLVEKVTPLGPIGTLISRTLKVMLSPSEKVLISFHQLQTSEAIAAGQPGSFGSLDLKLLTTERYLSLGFYPTYHHFEVRDVHKISHFSMQNRFATGYEGEGDATTAEERGFNPIEIVLEIRFEDEHGQEVLTWNQDASRAEDIRTLFKQLPVLSSLVGKALKQQ
ncbi:MAG: hypothetical protein CVV27_08900 [Candidatus Melainabacteria bacterium HGW-Melainabacteria-1]|nr:MAG: hypothetical protein CVV27_08900 [Candidatus Melainabacteria bacterium HGW-Melainabacteria-1]